jgi:hypothetical protein
MGSCESTSKEGAVLLTRYARWKAALAAAVLSLAVGAGVAVSTARADGLFTSSYEDGQYLIHNVSGVPLNVSDIEWIDQGDMQELYHWNFGCSSGTLEPNDSCRIWVEGTYGEIAVYTNEGNDDVILSSGS